MRQRFFYAFFLVAATVLVSWGTAHRDVVSSAMAVVLAAVVPVLTVLDRS